MTMYKALDVRLNRHKDMEEYAIKFLERAGVKYKKDDSLSVFFQSVNYIRKSILRKRRQVHVPNELQVPEEHKEGFNVFINASTLGQNLNVFLSRHILRAQAQDTLFNSLGLHHFHLGTSPVLTGKEKGLAKRTGYIVIALVREDDIYVVDICKHGTEGDPNTWTNPQYIRTLHKYWPNLLESFKFSDQAKPGLNLSDDEFTGLTKAGLTAFLPMDDGTVYMPTGGGMTTAKTSLNHTRDFDYYVHLVRAATLEIIQHIMSPENTTNFDWPINLKFEGFGDHQTVIFRETKALYMFMVVPMDSTKNWIITIPPNILAGRIHYDIDRMLPIVKNIKAHSNLF